MNNETMSKLTSSQITSLAKVCKTNGGGVSAFDFNENTLKALFSKGLVQGKKGQQHRVVHTEKGLNVFRKLNEGEK